MKKLIITFCLFIPIVASAQPKMHLKAWFGFNTHTANYRAEDIDSDFFYGWQGGFGFRMRFDQLFGELDFNFTRFALDVPLDIPDADSTVAVTANIQFNSFELPLLFGYVPLKTPLVKWYLQTGLVNRFNTKEIVTVEELDYKETFKPKEANLPGYNLYWRVGSQIDIAMINIGFNYSLNITNGIRGETRTNFHVLMLDVGFIF